MRAKVERGQDRREKAVRVQDSVQTVAKTQERLWEKQ